MFESTALNITIGIFLVFLTYSLLATAVQEALSTIFNLRAIILCRAIYRMLDGTSQGYLIGYLKKNKAHRLSTDFYKTPVIAAKKGGLIYTKPATLDSAIFADALIYVFKQKSDPNSFATYVQTLKRPDQPNSPGNYINHLCEESNSEADRFKAALAFWYDNMMMQASAWYKALTQIMLFAMGFLFAILFNVNCIKLVQTLSKDKVSQKQMVELATAQYKSLNPAPTLPVIDKNYSELVIDNQKLLDSLNHVSNNENNIMGLGYEKGQNFTTVMFREFTALPGWFITAIAISLGAPFWYDLLSKFVRIRSAMPSNRKTSKTPQE